MKRTLVSVMLLLAAACDVASDAPDPPVADAPAASSSEGVVDSIFPMDMMLARFREDVTEPVGLSGGAASRDQIVERVVRALGASDTVAFEELSLRLPEFAWLYFPSSAVAKPPYELPPALAWFRLQEGNRTGVLRALRELGGLPLRYQGYSCSEEPTVEGENRIWTGCTVTVSREAGDPVATKLFSSILERGGRFVVLSYENDF